MIRKSVSPVSSVVRQAMNSLESNRLKSNLVNQASKLVVKMLNGITKSPFTKVVSSSVEGLKGDRNFEGTLNLKVAATDKGNQKVLDIPITVKNSSISLPDAKIVAKNLSDIKVEDTLHKSVLEKVHSGMELIYKREEKAALEASKKEADKKAKEVNDINNPSGSSAIPNAMVAQQITYPKANLPIDLKAGDVISLSGRKYLLSEGKPGMGAVKASSEWILTLQNK